MSINSQKELVTILYKGDKISGLVYMMIGALFIFISIPLYFLGVSLGYIYLGIGLFVLAFYSLAKGLSIWWVSSKRMSFYKAKETLNNADLAEEIDYTKFRIIKKNRNRRWYLYTAIAGALTAFSGIFLQEKGLIMGTAIPIVLFAAIEFSIGLLVEFRLSEYQRQLHKF